MTTQQQFEILEEMQSHGFNICNCGNCGSIILFNSETKPKATDENEDIFCPHCKEVQAYSDCPDFYYEGSPDINDDEENDTCRNGKEWDKCNCC